MILDYPLGSLPGPVGVPHRSKPGGTSYKGKDKQVLTKEERNILDNALPLSEHLPDGRVRDIATGSIDHNNESSVYQVVKANGEELIVKRLKEASDIVGVHYTTLSKKLDVLSCVGAEINQHTIKRIKVFFVYPSGRHRYGGKGKKKLS
jgi:hypothetical protein